MGLKLILSILKAYRGPSHRSWLWKAVCHCGCFAYLLMAKNDSQGSSEVECKTRLDLNVDYDTKEESVLINVCY